MVFASVAFAQEVVTKGVGQIQKRLITSREVQIHHLIDSALNRKSQSRRFDPPSVDSKQFVRATQDVLLRMAIALEAEEFDMVSVTSAEVQQAERQVIPLLRQREAWRRLDVKSRELEEAIRRTLRAKKFVQLRSQSLVLPISDVEAQRHFNENRLRFRGMPFENIKDDIKNYLSRTQVERRLKDWYDLLLAKYQVKNLIRE